MILNRREREFIKDCKVVFNTESGKRVVAYLKELYVDSSAFRETDSKTNAALAVKEFVQGLVKVVERPQELEEIIIKNNQEEMD